MTLETLKGIREINGEKIVDMVALRDERPDMFREDGSMKFDMFEKEIRPNNYIYVRHDVNSISFTIQNGPIKEVGKNGCQVDDIIAVAKTILEGLNERFRCVETFAAIKSLDDALFWLNKRKEDREKRGVEGFNKE